MRRVVELVPASPLSPQGRLRNSELQLQEQLQARKTPPKWPIGSAPARLLRLRP